jgi:hypothetical protein
MISAIEIAAARAVPIADLVGSVVPLKRDFGLCPFHDERTPSFHIERKRNIFFCFGCGARGDPIAWIRLTKRVDFRSAIHELIGGTAIGSPPVWQEKAPRATQVPSLVLALWRTATAPRLAQFYLESRNIAQKALPQALRGHERVWCSESGQHRPAMLAAVTNGAGRVTAIARTWVEDRLVYDGETEFPKGARAAGLSAPKKTLGPMGNGAVRLAAAGEVLGLSEGVESSLAAAKLFRLPVWATCGTARMGKGDVELPEIVRRVVIFGDNDEPGRAAAAKAETAYRRRGYSCQSEFPESDWAAAARG